MRKQFEKRARLVVYMEQLDLAKLQAEHGRGLTDWARTRLLDGEEGFAKNTVPATHSVAQSLPSNAYMTEQCAHGATRFNCKKWGCKFYEIANGRG